MTAKSDELINELVSAAIAFGREREPDWQTRIEKARCELKTYVAELELERRWIPVSERLPEEYRDERCEFIPFLVCENDKDYPFRALYDGKNWGDGMFIADVTHWMPLPKLPEVK